MAEQQYTTVQGMFGDLLGKPADPLPDLDIRRAYYNPDRRSPQEIFRLEDLARKRSMSAAEASNVGERNLQDQETLDAINEISGAGAMVAKRPDFVSLLQDHAEKAKEAAQKAAEIVGEHYAETGLTPWEQARAVGKHGLASTAVDQALADVDRLGWAGRRMAERAEERAKPRPADEEARASIGILYPWQEAYALAGSHALRSVAGLEPGFVDQVKDAFAAGEMQQFISQLGNEGLEMIGRGASPEEISGLRRKVALAQEAYSGFHDDETFGLYGTIEQLGRMGTRDVPMAVGGAIVGGAVGMAVPILGPARGAKIGAGLATFETSRQLETGSFMADLLLERDEAGNFVDVSGAAGYAYTYGAIAGAIEVFGDYLTLGAVRPARRAFMQLMKRGAKAAVKDALVSKGMEGPLKQLAKTLVEAGFGQFVEESLQEAAQIGLQTAYENKVDEEGRNYWRRPQEYFTKENIKQVWDAGWSGFEMGVWFGLLPGAGHYLLQMGHADRALKFALRQKELAVKLDEQNRKETGLKGSVEATESFLQSNGLSDSVRVSIPAVAIAELDGRGLKISEALGMNDPEALAEAAENGQEVVLPLASVHARLSLEQMTAVADYMRQAPDAMTAAEAQELNQFAAEDAEKEASAMAGGATEGVAAARETKRLFKEVEKSAGNSRNLSLQMESLGKHGAAHFYTASTMGRLLSMVRYLVRNSVGGVTVSQILSQLSFDNGKFVAKSPELSQMLSGQTESYDRLMAETAGLEELTAPNGQKSNLSREDWVRVRTPEFIERWGNWMTDPESSRVALDENGEPILEKAETAGVSYMQAKPAERKSGVPQTPGGDGRALAQYRKENPEGTEKGDALKKLTELLSLEGARAYSKSQKWGAKQLFFQRALNAEVLELAKKAGIDLSDRESPLTSDLLVETIKANIRTGAVQNKSAVGWYDPIIHKMFAVAEMKFPEFKTDKLARFAFIYALAVTSNGQRVSANLPMAVKAYEYWASKDPVTGERREVFPKKVGTGQTAKAIDSSLAAFPEVRDLFRGDDSQLIRFFMTSWKVGQLGLMGIDAGGELAEVYVRAAALLGPKIGNGFFSNLYGEYGALTMDRWFMRSFGRWTGTMIPGDWETQLARASKNLREVLVGYLGNEEVVSFLKKHGFDMEARLDDDYDTFTEAAEKFAKEKYSDPNKNIRDEQVKALGDKVSDSIRTKFNLVLKWANAEKQAPAGGGEREYIRQLFNMALTQLHESTDKADLDLDMKTLTMADAQAILWYAEKRIYETLNMTEEEVARAEAEKRKKKEEEKKAAKEKPEGGKGKKGKKGKKAEPAEAPKEPVDEQPATDYMEGDEPDYFNVMAELMLGQLDAEGNEITAERIKEAREKAQSEIDAQRKEYPDANTAQKKYDVLSPDEKPAIFARLAFVNFWRQLTKAFAKNGEGNLSKVPGNCAYRRTEGAALRSGGGVVQETGDNEGGLRGNGGRPRVLEGADTTVSVIAHWECKGQLERALQTFVALKSEAKGFPLEDALKSAAVGFYELDSGDEASVQAFRAAVEKAKKAQKYGACVTLHTTEELRGMRLFLSPDGQAGFALEDGDNIVSVFSAPTSHAGHAIIECAKAAGGRRLDCFNTILPDLYSIHGFVPVATVAFDRKFAPEGWDYDLFAKYNGGEPVIVFMVLDESYNGTAVGQLVDDAFPVKAYDEGVAIQKHVCAINELQKVNEALAWGVPAAEAEDRRVAEEKAAKAAERAKAKAQAKAQGETFLQAGPSETPEELRREAQRQAEAAPRIFYHGARDGELRVDKGRNGGPLDPRALFFAERRRDAAEYSGGGAVYGVDVSKYRILDDIEDVEAERPGKAEKEFRKLLKREGVKATKRNGAYGLLWGVVVEGGALSEDDEAKLAGVLGVDEGEVMWRCQRLRLDLARALGFQGARMYDDENSVAILQEALPERLPEMDEEAAELADADREFFEYVANGDWSNAEWRVRKAAEEMGAEGEVDTTPELFDANGALLPPSRRLREFTRRGKEERARLEKLDREYFDAIERGDAEAVVRMVLDAAAAAGYWDPVPEISESYRLRTKPAPKKTKIVYKTFYIDPAVGLPTTLFVSGSEHIPLGVWLDATEPPYKFQSADGTWYVPTTKNPNRKSKTGGKTGSSIGIPNDRVRQELIRGGYLPEGSDAASVTAVAYRPGWHASVLPHFPQGGIQIGKKKGENMHEYNKVVFECEICADTDYTEAARSQPKAITKAGTVYARAADFQYMVDDGFYYYTTNATLNPEDNAWVISNSIKINRALTQEECDAMLKEAGEKVQPWEGGKLDLAALNITDPERSDAGRKTLAPITYDSAGNIIPLSQRFDPASPSVLYQGGPQEGQGDIDGQQLLQASPSLYQRALDVIQSLLQAAWHGSPFEILGRLSLSRIGTGEGAAVHGWGLYFAQTREVSDVRYRKRLLEKNVHRGKARPSLVVDDERLSPDETAEEYPKLVGAYNTALQERPKIEPLRKALEAYGSLPEGEEFNGYPFDPWKLEELGVPFFDMVKEAEREAGKLPGGSAREDVTAALRKALSEAEGKVAAAEKAMDDILADIGEGARLEGPQGSLLKVELPENDFLLDEDKVVEDQPARVRKALEELCRRGAIPSKVFWGGRMVSLSADERRMYLLGMTEEDEARIRERIDDAERREDAVSGALKAEIGENYWDDLRARTPDVNLSNLDDYIRRGDVSAEDRAKMVRIREAQRQKEAIREEVAGARAVLEKGRRAGTMTGGNVRDALEDMFRDSRPYTAKRDAALAFDSVGIPGLTYDGRIDGRCFVIWNEDAIQVIDEAERLNQGMPANRNMAKGGITRFADGKFAISLFEGADLSTVFHESAHFYFMMARDLARRGLAGPQLLADLKTLDEWTSRLDDDAVLEEEYNLYQRRQVADFKGKAFKDLTDVEREAARARAKEEWLARGFEQYLREGTVPSSKLKSVFARIKEWMLQIYRQAMDLHVELTNDVRGVFDRMVANGEDMDIEADTLQVRDETKAILDSLGVRGAERLELESEISAAKSAAADKLRRLRDRRRRENLRRWTQEAAAEAREEKPQKVRQALREAKVDVGSVREAVGDDAANQFMRKLPGACVKEGGVDIGVLASEQGYSSVRELVDEMLAAPSLAERIDALRREKEDAHDGETDPADILYEQEEIGRQQERIAKALERKLSQVTAESRYRNEVEGRTVGGEPVQVTDEDRAKYAGNEGLARYRVGSDQLKASAAAALAKLPAQRACSPSQFRHAAARFMQQERRAILRGNWEKALEFNYKARINIELARQAAELRDLIEKVQSETERRLNMKAASVNGRYAIYKVATAVDLIPTTRMVKGVPTPVNRHLRNNAEGKGPENIEAFLAEMREAGFLPEKDSVDPGIDPKVFADGPLDWRTMTWTQLAPYVDALARLLKAERDMRTVLVKGKREDLKNFAARLAKSIEDHVKAQPKDRFAKTARNEAALRRLHVSHLTADTIALLLDGDSLGGLAWNALIRPINDATGNRQDRLDKAKKGLEALFGMYSRKELLEMKRKRYSIPGVTDVMTHEQALCILLNWGNKSSRERVMQGHDLTEDQVARIIAVLDEKDCKFAQSVWDYLETFRQEAFDLEEEMTGSRPERIEPEPVRTRFGVLRGGYYPAVYDNEESAKASDPDVGKQTRAMHAGVEHGTMKARVGKGLGAKLNLSLGVIPRHVVQTCHMLAFRKPVAEVAKLLRRREVNDAIQKSMGVEFAKALDSWLKYVAGERAPVDCWYNKAAGWIRTRAAFAAMALKLTTMLAQVCGLLFTVPEIGLKYTLCGVADMFAGGNPLKVYNSVLERSAFMRYRIAAIDREIFEKSSDLVDLGDSSRVLDPVKRVQRFMQQKGFLPMAYVQMFFADLPTWLGAYRKRLEETQDVDEAIHYADATVTRTQGGGAEKDLAAVQRGQELGKLMTMYYTVFGALYNLSARRITMLNRNRDMASVFRLGTLLLCAWFAEPVITGFLQGKGPDDDEPDKKDWALWAAKEAFFNPGQMVVGVRDIMNAIESQLEGYGSSFNLGSGLGVIDQAIRAGSQDVKLAKGEGEAKKAVLQTAKSAGQISGTIPTQFMLLVEAFWDWLDGTTPEFDAWSILRKKRKKQ